MKKVSSSWNQLFVTQLYSVLGLQIVVFLKIQCFSNYKKRAPSQYQCHT